MTTPKLKPCAHCGAAAYVGNHYIACADCGLQTRMCLTEETAIEVWNRRAEDAELARLREQLRIAREGLGNIAAAIRSDYEPWEEAKDTLKQMEAVK